MFTIGFVFSFFILSFFCCYFSFLYLNKRIKVKNLELNTNNDDAQDDTVEVEGVAGDRIRFISKSKSVMFSFVFALISFALGFVVFDNVTSLLNFWRLAFVCVIAYGIAIIDYKLKIIPNLYVLIFLAGGTVFHIIDFVQSLNSLGFAEILKSFFFNNIFLTLVVVIILWFIALLMHGGMGYGDIKFLGALCYFSGIGTLVFSLSVALFISLLVACVLILMKKKKTKDEIPFGPFMAAGIIICAFLGLL